MSVATIVAIIVIAVLLILADLESLLGNKISIGIMLLVFGLNSLIFLILLKKDNSETSLKNISLKKAFFTIIAYLSFLSMVWTIVNNSFGQYYLNFISSVCLLFASIHVLKNLKRKKIEKTKVNRNEENIKSS